MFKKSSISKYLERLSQKNKRTEIYENVRMVSVFENLRQTERDVSRQTVRHSRRRLIS